MMVWFTGTALPLILMLIGAPTEMKMSDAFLSAMTWNRRFIADIGFPSLKPAASLIAPQQFVEACLGPRLRVDLFYNDRTVQAVACVGGGQSAGNHHRPGRDAAIADLAARPVEDLGALAEEHAHGNHAVLLDDDPFHHLGAGADEAVVLDDDRVGLHRLQDAADAHAAGKVHVLADLRAGAHRGPGIHHGAHVDVGADVDEGGHEDCIFCNEGAATHGGRGHHPEAALLEVE